jgi:hypothetical protein
VVHLFMTACGHVSILIYEWRGPKLLRAEYGFRICVLATMPSSYMPWWDHIVISLIQSGLLTPVALRGVSPRREEHLTDK